MKIILDICGGTGSWSKPYQENDQEYIVYNLTLPDFDILKDELPVDPLSIYGILAAPPCTDFSVAGNRLWKQKDENGQTKKSLDIVFRCMEIIKQCRNIRFWALENPRGRLKNYIGTPSWELNYKDFGCNYSKIVLLWGSFTPPLPEYIAYSNEFIKAKLPELPKEYILSGSNMTERAARRSITYNGFAKAFYAVNR